MTRTYCPLCETYFDDGRTYCETHALPIGENIDVVFERAFGIPSIMEFRTTRTQYQRDPQRPQYAKEIVVLEIWRGQPGQIPGIDEVLAELHAEDPIEAFLKYTAKSLEPQTHCCECTHSERHIIHIQYPNCECDPKHYVLPKEEGK